MMMIKKHLAVAVLALLAMGFMSARADAQMLTYFNHDATSHAVYYAFDTAFGIDAYRVSVRQIGVGVVGMHGGHPHLTPADPGISAAGVVGPLASGSPHRFILRVRLFHNGPWVTVRNFPFMTNP